MYWNDNRPELITIGLVKADVVSRQERSEVSGKRKKSQDFFLSVRRHIFSPSTNFTSLSSAYMYWHAGVKFAVKPSLRSPYIHVLIFIRNFNLAVVKVDHLIPKFECNSNYPVMIISNVNITICTYGRQN